MIDTLRAACVQLNGQKDRAENRRAATDLIRQAAGAGAQLICTPEFTCQMVAVEGPDRLAGSPDENANPLLAHYRQVAAELGVWLLIGSMAVRTSGDKMVNRSHLLDNKGDIVAIYDKIHLFDVDLPNGQRFRESAIFNPGDRAVVAATPWGGLGMAICYDLRFAGLFRALAQNGARILTLPAAFSAHTGKTSWEVYLRARALETGSFVLAPAQCGAHEDGRRHTWGHSMIIGPVGEILAEAGDEPGFIIANMDLSASDKARSAIPALKQDRNFTVHLVDKK